MKKYFNKHIINFFLLIFLSSCANSQKNNENYIIRNLKLAISEIKNTSRKTINLFVAQRFEKNLSLQKPDIKNDDEEVEGEILEISNIEDNNRINQAKMIKDEYQPIFKFSLENNNQRQPFENPEDLEIFDHDAVFGFGIKHKNDFEFFLQSNIANINFDPNNNQNNQLQINFSDPIDEISTGIKIEF